MTRNEQLARDGYEALMRGEAEVVEDSHGPRSHLALVGARAVGLPRRDEAMALIRERMARERSAS